MDLSAGRLQPSQALDELDLIATPPTGRPTAWHATPSTSIPRGTPTIAVAVSRATAAPVGTRPTAAPGPWAVPAASTTPCHDSRQLGVAGDRRPHWLRQRGLPFLRPGLVPGDGLQLGVNLHPERRLLGRRRLLRGWRRILRGGLLLEFLSRGSCRSTGPQRRTEYIWSRAVD